VAVGLAESENKEVELAAVGPATAQPAATTGDGRKTAGWVAIGFGGVALGVGLLGGALALGKKGTLEDNCTPTDEGTLCPNEYEGDLDAYRAAGAVATVGFIAGALGLGAGAVLLLTAPDPAPKAGGSKVTPPRVDAWIGAGRAGLRGSF